MVELFGGLVCMDGPIIFFGGCYCYQFLYIWLVIIVVILWVHVVAFFEYPLLLRKCLSAYD